MWPAMWPGYPNPGAVFFLDDPENQRLADEYGICISTSHHEPMQRATTEWFEEGRSDGTWNWTTHREEIIDFFRKGVTRAKGLESYFTMGIRGEYDKGMVTKDPGAVLRDVLEQQRSLFKKVHGREDAVPQVLALYKEVQDLYQAGEFKVPDDVTLLFADDNFGTLRRLPSGSEKSRAGGAGVSLTDLSQFQGYQNLWAFLIYKTDILSFRICRSASKLQVDQLKLTGTFN